jgi:hypothetical protein
LPFVVTFESGIQKYSGLLDIAMDAGLVIKPSNGWYSRIIDSNTGEVESKKWRFADTQTKEFWEVLFNNPKFNEFIRHSYRLGMMDQVVSDTEIEKEYENNAKE